MTEPGFRVEEVDHGLHFRARAAFGSYFRFEVPGRTAVLIEPETARALRVIAAESCPNETGGLLAGRVFRDADGRFVVVSGYVEAGPDAGGPGTFIMSPAETARLRTKSSRLFPTADVVGWWHSHTRPSHYSSTDRATQAMWTQPDSVGLLVFAEGRPWGTAYLGPEAEPIPALVVPKGNSHGGGASRRPGAEPVAVPVHAVRPAGALVRRPSAGTLIRVLIAIVIVVLLLGVAIRWAQRVSGAVTSDQQQLSRVSQQMSSVSGLIGKAPSDPAAPLTVAWHCDPRARRSYECFSTLTGASSGTVLWLLDGVRYSTAPDVIVNLPAHRAQSVIHLYVSTPTGIRDCGSENLVG
jgi:type II secretory pathway pseudopilin PulG/proteasome lid subunit RPN8/RPN11